MLGFKDIPDNYLQLLVEFLRSYSWIFEVSNTQYVKKKIIQNNEKFLNLFKINDDFQSSEITSTPSVYDYKAITNYNLTCLEHLDDFLTSQEHPAELVKFIRQLNFFRINFDIIDTDSWRSKNSQNKLSVKKLYEIENIGKLINDECDGVDVLIDLGSGLGYLDEFLHVNYCYKIVGLEGSEKIHMKAIERQEKYYPKSIGAVKHVHHFITQSSGDFIVSEAKNFKNDARIALFGLHPCGDLSVISIDLFLNNEEVKTIIISPCCYHKMSGVDEECSGFNYFPLSEELKGIFKSYSTNPFLRAFLRLAGQQSPEKVFEMSQEEHFTHGKMMFGRAMADAIINDDETIKGVNNAIDPNDRLQFEDIKTKYKIYNKFKNEISWSTSHEERFNDIRSKIPFGEEQSEDLSCLQASIQNCCENLVIIDRINYIKEQASVRGLKLEISVKKLQNEKLSPRCHVFVVKKIK